MNEYLLLPLISCIACCTLATGIIARDWSRRVSRLGVLVVLCGAWWSFCEVLWNTASDPDTALRLIRVSAFGWMTIGPAILHLFLELTSHPARNARGLWAGLYVPPIVLAVIDNTTAWVHPAAVAQSWGFGFEVGPLFPLGLLLGTGGVSIGLYVAYVHLRDLGSPAELRQTKWILGGLAVPLTVASFTDGIFPMLGIQMPRLGASSITVFTACVAWTFHRFGYSLMAPGVFANEIVSTLREGIAVLRLDGRIHSVNAGMSRLVGLDRAGLEGRPIADLLDVELPQPPNELMDLECKLGEPDGASVPVAVCSSLLFDKQGNPMGQLLVARDLREIESLRSRLITSGRLASVGQLAAGIAHEINNPVAFVRANLGSLADILERMGETVAATDEKGHMDLEDGRELIAESLDGVDRVTAIVRDVKGFSHSGEGQPEAVDVASLLESVLRVAAPQLRYSGSIDRDFADVPPVRGVAQELKQVFLNLLINASQAVESSDTIRLVTRRADDCVIVEVQDQGCGIPPDQMERVFDPFFTTKAVGEGTGLGLSISYQIVKRHGGEITVESEVGRGTCFRVELPIADVDSTGADG